MVGLVNTIRQRAPDPEPDEEGQDVDIGATIIASSDKPALVIDLPDGSVNVYQNAGQKDKKPLDPKDFYANLALSIGESDLGIIAEELLLGIDEDNLSRRDWLDERAEGIKLLALKIEKPTGSSSAQGAGNDNNSRTRHTMLLEACLRFQANARGELLPTDGPIKVESKNSDDTIEGDDLAQQLEDDLNYYLTTTASEFYPDTDRMLFWVGAGGVGFKKVYRCPIRRRPVSESVDAADLIISNAATDFLNADRVTFVSRMRQSTMKRMQFLKVYRHVDLGQPTAPQLTAVDEQKEEVTGVTISNRPEDIPYTIYECYCMIDVPGDEHKEKGEVSGLPRPYKVTIDKSSRNVLEIRRNWKQDDELERPRETFVKFPYVPIMGFYETGLIQIGGNPTVAATALQRIMTDAGIFANFPGFLVSKSSDKQNTTDITVNPGSGAPIDTSMAQDGDIRKVVLPLPYKEPGPAIMELFQDIVKQGSGAMGSPEISVGEGKQDAPVGTTIALIEQATKVTDAVHKRLHTAQSKEFELLRDLFRENPEDFWKFNKDRDLYWNKDLLLKALFDYNLTPRADPNTSSQMQRIMRAQALYMMAAAHPELFQVTVVQEYVLRTLGIRNPQAYMQAAPPAGSQPDPKLLSAQADMQDSQTKAGELALKAKTFDQQMKNDADERQEDLQVANTKLETEKVIHLQQAQQDFQSQVSSQRHERAMQQTDLQADQGQHAAGLVNDAQMHQGELQQNAAQQSAQQQTDLAKHVSGLVSDHALQAKDHIHQQGLASASNANQQELAKLKPKPIGAAKKPKGKK